MKTLILMIVSSVITGMAVYFSMQDETKGIELSVSKTNKTTKSLKTTPDKNIITNFQSKIKEIENKNNELISENKILQQTIDELKSSSPSVLSATAKPNFSLDLSSIPSVSGKIKRVLLEFDDSVHSYSYGNALAKKIVALGQDAVEPLLKELQNSKDLPFCAKSLLNDTLEKLLNETHKDIIIEQFEKNDRFLSLIKKYKFPEINNLLTAKIKKATKKKGYLNYAIIDTALSQNKDETLPLLLNHIETGGALNQNLLDKLSTYPNVDLDTSLKIASKNLKHKTNFDLSKTLLDRGLVDGLDIAINILRKNKMGDFSSKRIKDQLRKVVSVDGNNDEIADWLEQNKDSLTWNPTTRRFE